MKKRFLVSFFAALILLTAVNLPPAEANGGQPFLQPVETSYQTAPQKAGQSVSHDFVFRNTGTATLKIMRVSPSCNCTVASYDKEVPPGGSGKVTLRVDVKPEWAGKTVIQSAVVVTNDKLAKKFRLKLTVPVRP